MERQEQMAKRLRQARLMKKLSLDELHGLLGKGAVSKQALSKYESGEVKPTEEMLRKIAKVLDTDLDFFYRPFIFDIDNVKVEFRKRQKMSEKDVKALKMHIQDDIEKYLEVEQLLGGENETQYDTLRPQETIATQEDAEDFAQQVRAAWQLGESGIVNMYTLVEQVGMKIIDTEGPDDFDGVSGIINGKEYVIVLNTKLNNNPERRRFTTLHEVGHLLMQGCIEEDLTLGKVEKVCHAFASEMLLPGAALRKIIGGKPNLTFTDLINVQMCYGISIDAIMHRMHRLEMVSDAQYISYNIKKKKSANFKAYVEASRFRESKLDKLREMTFQAVMMEMMTYDRAAQLLKLDAESVEQEAINKIRLKQWAE